MLLALLFEESQLTSKIQTPAPAQGALAVWYGSMPESNGKSNWTAILHRGDLSEGHTIARSEYPDRVRYYADKVRWLIGELADEPDILAYDDTLHSGYVAPAEVPSPAVAHGWRPIGEAPKDGAEVWAFNGEQARMKWIEGDGYALWTWADTLLSDTDPMPEQPTHFMPLPADPILDVPVQGIENA